MHVWLLVIQNQNTIVRLKNIKEITKVDLDEILESHSTGMGIYRATIEMKLPIEASDDDGILTRKNGTMIYGKKKMMQ